MSACSGYLGLTGHRVELGRILETNRNIGYPHNIVALAGLCQLVYVTFLVAGATL